MGSVFYVEDTIFDAFVQELLNLPTNLLLALYLVYPRYLFNMPMLILIAEVNEQHAAQMH